MHWLWYLAFGYLAFCAAGWLFSFWMCPGQASYILDDDRIRRALRKHPIRMRLALLTTALLLVPLFPLVFGYGAWKCWREDREWQTFRRTFRPVEFEAIHPANLPTEAQKHFDACTPILERLGFVRAVTCRLKPEPRPVLAQCLLGRDGAIVAEASWIFGTPAASFISVLADGHVLETGCVEVSLPQDEIEAINRSGCFSAQMFAVGEGGNFAKEAFLSAAYRSHLHRLAELEERFGCGTLHISADQIPDFKRYENAVFGQWRFDHGKVDNRPEPQPSPVGSRSCSSYSESSSQSSSCSCSDSQHSPLPGARARLDS